MVFWRIHAQAASSKMPRLAAATRLFDDTAAGAIQPLQRALLLLLLVLLLVLLLLPLLLFVDVFRIASVCAYSFRYPCLHVADS